MARARGKGDDLFSTTVFINWKVRERRGGSGPRAPGRAAPEVGRERNRKAAQPSPQQPGDDGKEGSESESRTHAEPSRPARARGAWAPPGGRRGAGRSGTCCRLRGGRSGDGSVRRRGTTRGSGERAQAPAGPEGKGQAAPSDPAGTPRPPAPPGPRAHTNAPAPRAQSCGRGTGRTSAEGRRPGWEAASQHSGATAGVCPAAGRARGGDAAGTHLPAGPFTQRHRCHTPAQTHRPPRPSPRQRRRQRRRQRQPDGRGGTAA